MEGGKQVILYRPVGEKENIIGEIQIIKEYLEEKSERKENCSP